MAKRKKPVPDLIRRNRALAVLLARFGKQQLKLGTVDCIKMVRFHLVKMGHRGLPSPQKYSTLKGAKSELNRLGFDSLEQLFDHLLKRIPPAAMLPGDIGLVMAEEGEVAWELGTVVVSVGRKFLGWHPDHPMLAVIDPLVETPFTAAWRA